MAEGFFRSKKGFTVVQNEITRDATSFEKRWKTCYLGYGSDYRRIEMVVDKDSFEPMFEGLNTRNPLKMKGYEAKVQALRDKTGLDEAVTTGRATIGGNSVAIAVCDGRFLMASMGEVVGEKIAKTVEYATKENIPVIIFACSGGARMQEGMVSLMHSCST